MLGYLTLPLLTYLLSVCAYQQTILLSVDAFSEDVNTLYRKLQKFRDLSFSFRDFSDLKKGRKKEFPLTILTIRKKRKR